MLTLPQEFQLLALDPKGDNLIYPLSAYEMNIADCVLFELNALRRIRRDGKFVEVTDPTPTGDPVFDRVLDDIQKSRTPRTAKQWYMQYGMATHNLISEQVAAQLIAKGCLHLEEKRVLGLMVIRRYLAGDTREEEALKERLRRAIRGEMVPDSRTWWLLELVNSYRMEGALYPKEKFREARQEIDALFQAEAAGLTKQRVAERTQGKASAPGVVPAPAAAPAAYTAPPSVAPAAPINPNGQIVRVQGPVIEAQFNDGHTPAFWSALQVIDPYRNEAALFCVVQQQGEGLVRAVALSSLPGIMPGWQILDTDSPVNQPIPEEFLIPAVRAGAGSRSLVSARQETGLKALDLFCPLMQGNRIGVYGEWGTGLLVLLPELLHRLAGQEGDLLLLGFAPPQPDPAKWRGNNTELSGCAGKAHIMLFPVQDPNSAALYAQLDFLDAAICLTRRLATRGLYPPIDPLASTSKALEASMIAGDQIQIARQVQQLLRRNLDLQPRLQTLGLEGLLPDEQQTVARAARIERYLSQPLYVAEPYTGVPGETVSCLQTLQDCMAILSGPYDTLPEQAFYMIGSLAQAVEKAARLANAS